MKARQSFLPFTLGLLDCISASPVLSPRQELTDTGYNTSTTAIIENVQSNVTSKLLTANITETISKWITAAQIPGLSISITTPDGDEVLTFGQEDALGTPVSNETYWGIASNSKLITGMALAILEQRNTTLPNGEAFTLDTSVVNIIDEFQMWDSNTTESITTRDFLTHMSGLPSHNFAFVSGLTPSDWLTNLPHLKTLNPLGAQFEYSNVNYVMASAIIESLTNRSFPEAVDSLIFEPLGINITWNAIDAEERGNRSQGFRKYGLDVGACNSPDGGLEACGIQEGFDYWTEGSGEEFSGAASALMSGLDMLAWTKALVNPSADDSDTPITTHLLDLVSGNVDLGTSVEVETGSGITYGLGEYSTLFRGYNATYHDGALPGQYTSLYRMLNKSIGVFVACNDDQNGALFSSSVARTVLADLLDLPYQDEFLFAQAISAPVRGDSSLSSAVPSETSSSTANSKRSGSIVKRSVGQGFQDIRGGKATRPTNPRSAPDNLAGSSYAAPAYGNFTLHSLDLNNETSIEEAAFPLQFLLGDIVTELGDSIYLGGPNYYAHWNRSIATHLIFTHWDGPHFNVTTMLVLDRAMGEVEIQTEMVPVNGSQYVALTYGAGPAVFDQEKGLGFFGNFLRGFGYIDNLTGERPEAVESGIEEGADLYMKRI